MINLNLLQIAILIFAVFKIYKRQERIITAIEKIVYLDDMLATSKQAVEVIAQKIKDEDPDLIAELVKENIKRDKKEKERVTEFTA
jgi:hypothetical protein